MGVDPYAVNRYCGDALHLATVRRRRSGQIQFLPARSQTMRKLLSALVLAAFAATSQASFAQTQGNPAPAAAEKAKTEKPAKSSKKSKKSTKKTKKSSASDAKSAAPAEKK